HKKPHAFQVIEGKERDVKAEFQEISANTFGFSLGQYNSQHNLIIDPLVFVYSTFLGGSELEEGHDIDTDANGRPYITGDSASSNFPTTVGAYDPTLNGGTDVFVTKFNTTGTDLLYSTFIGGLGEDRGFGIYVEPEGFAYIAGSTRSGDFPTTAGAYNRVINGGSDAFIAKLNKAGSELMLSTFIGGFGDDSGYGITLDTEGAIYITGATESTDFPTTPGADDRIFGGQTDAFVVKTDSAASELIYATYVGDVEIEECFDIITDSTGAAYITGFTDPGTNADSDVLAVKMNRKGAAQAYSFVFGGSDDESGRGITVDDTGAAYIVGWTESANFPTTPEAFDRTQNGHTDAFVSKLKPAGSGFIYSTYLGGDCWDYGEDIDLYENLSAIVTGYTTASSFPVTPNAFDTTHNGKLDAFVTKFNPSGSGLEYSTFLGGAESDLGMGIAVDTKEIAHVAGTTSSSDFPATPDAYDRKIGLISDAFYAKFALVWPISIAITHPSSGTGVAGIIPVNTEVVATGTVADVQFYLDSAHYHTDYDAPYGFSWDTAVLSNGQHRIRAWATDSDGYGAFHESSVYVLNGTMDLQVERGVYETWLFKKPYAELILTVISSQTQAGADWYAFFRKAEGEDFVQLRAFQRNDLQGNTLTFKDMPLDADKAYTYYVVAVAEGGEIMGISPEVTK
ncbi:MAG: SBBP repeat-containing protein, partial [Candidatus Aminicenantes bacterium]|nr:SBBP repeat-containing protein [Candidatus Aminicenantes bacterium]